jgi:predicted amidophosphoribosyltransferase
MRYDFDEMKWEANKLSLFLYHSVRSGSQNDVSRRLLRFKNDEDISVEWFQQYSTQAIAQSELDFLDTAENWYVVAIPGSTANNEPCERICSHLAENFSWMHYVPHALQRVQPVPKSATAYWENRPRTSRQDHERTIQYVGPRPPQLHSAYGIITVDDILTTSNTFNACCGILEKATGCEHIFGFFLGRTPLPE